MCSRGWRSSHLISISPIGHLGVIYDSQPIVMPVYVAARIRVKPSRCPNNLWWFLPQSEEEGPIRSGQTVVQRRPALEDQAGEAMSHKIRTQARSKSPQLAHFHYEMVSSGNRNFFWIGFTSAEFHGSPCAKSVEYCRIQGKNPHGIPEGIPVPHEISQKKLLYLVLSLQRWVSLLFVTGVRVHVHLHIHVTALSGWEDLKDITEILKKSDQTDISTKKSMEIW